MTRKIVTHHKFPPIPDRSQDWSAYDENTYEPGDIDGETGQYTGGNCLVGWGATEAEALADLERRYTEEAEYQEDRRQELERVNDPRMDPRL